MSHPVGLSGSLFSAHLNVTLLLAGVALTGDPRALWALCDLISSALTELLSSSSSRARNEQEEGGDWTALAL